jgi:hypothetical protein
MTFKQYPSNVDQSAVRCKMQWSGVSRAPNIHVYTVLE